MSHSYSQLTVTEPAYRLWIPAALAGLAGGIVMGIPMVFMSNMATLVGALFGVESVAGGLAGHFLISLLFAGAYAEFTSYGRLKRLTLRYESALALGLAWGVVLYSTAAGVVMPLWLQALNIPTTFSVPVVNPLLFAGHLLYGGTLGLTFAALRRSQ